MAQPWNLGPGLMNFSGLAQLGDPIAKAFKDRRDTEALLAAYDQSQPVSGSLAALGQGVPTPSSPQAPTVPGTASLIQSESGGNFGAQNNAVGAGGQVGHFGRAQFGQARLQEAAAAGAIPQGTTPQQFMASPELQKSAENWHFGDIDRHIRASGYDQLVGQSINGVPVTADGLRSVAHLGGKGGLDRFVKSGGRYNPKDANGTSLMDYLARHQGGATPQVAQADMPAPGAAEAQGMLAGGQPASRQNVNGQMIRGLLANPGTRDIGKQLWAQTLTGRQYGFQVVGDQLYRTNPRTGQVEAVSGVTKPAAPVTVGEGQTLVDPSSGRVVFQGQPKRDQAAAYEERRVQAERSGLKETDPGYQSFILTGKMPREDAQPLTATDKKAIIEADEGVEAATSAVSALQEAKRLSPNAFGGKGASTRATIVNNLPGAIIPDTWESSGQTTAQLDNLVGTNALSQLKAIFGGNPTEGERAIMMELQGSSSQPDSVRQKIYDRAIAMAERRLAFQRQRATELRGGSYYKPQAGDPGGARTGAPRGSQAQQTQQPDASQAKQASDGNWYVPDPNRPGKYLMVQP